MTDRFLPISLDVMVHVFPAELAYIREHRFDYIEYMPEVITLLSENKLSQWHVTQIRARMMAEAEAEKKNLVGSHC